MFHHVNNHSGHFLTEEEEDEHEEGDAVEGAVPTHRTSLHNTSRKKLGILVETGGTIPICTYNILGNISSWDCTVVLSIQTVVIKVLSTLVKIVVFPLRRFVTLDVLFIYVVSH
jgi:hypothetical protein